MLDLTVLMLLLPLLSYKHGYDGANVVNIAYGGSTTPQNGDFSMRLLDSTTGETCNLRWTINTGNVITDPNFSNDTLSGSLIDGVNTGDVSVWFGYILNGQPIVGPNCANLDGDGQVLLNELQQGSPGFGYAMLTSDFVTLRAHMMSNHPAGWSNIEDKVLVGLASFTTYSSNGSRMYYPINQTFVYKVVTTDIPWATSWTPTSTVIPQGNAMTTNGFRNPSGFYVSETYFPFEAPFQ